MPLWKQHQSGDSHPSLPLNPTPARPAAPQPTTHTRPVTTSDEARLTHTVVIRGQISGTGSLFLDGSLEGSIEIANDRVTIGPNGRVHAPAGQSGPCITAREIVVMGQVQGSICAQNRVEIRANGSVTGDISSVRISIEDGAFFRGGIDIRQPSRPEAEPPHHPAADLAGTAV